MHPTEEGEACNICESCVAFNEQRSLNIFELDAASNNSTDDIRRLIEEVSVPPQFGNYKVYIIDEVHMLSQSAFNAFLKTLEEPPSYVVFILATTERQKILPTILSRCQVYDFKPIPSEIIYKQLDIVAKSENISVDSKALEIIAKQADGGMRDALSLFDRIAGFGNGKISYEETIQSLHILNESYYLKIAEYIYKNDASALLYLVDEVIDKGFDPRSVLLGLQEFFRKLMYSADNTTLSIADLSEQEKPIFSKLALDLGRSFIYQALLKLTEAEKVYRASSSKRLLLEMTLVGLTSIGRELPSGGLNPRPIHASSMSAPRSEQIQGAPVSNPTEKPSVVPVSTASSLGQTSRRRSRVGSGVIDLQQLQEKAAASVESSATLTKGIVTSNAETMAPVSFDEENLAKAWQLFVTTKIPSEKVRLLHVLHTRKPSIVDDKTITLLAVSHSEKALLEDIEPELLRYLKSFFAKDQMFLTIGVDEVAKSKFSKSKREWFDEQKENNNALKNFYNSLDLREI